MDDDYNQVTLIKIVLQVVRQWGSESVEEGSKGRGESRGREIMKQYFFFLLSCYVSLNRTNISTSNGEALFH